MRHHGHLITRRKFQGGAAAMVAFGAGSHSFAQTPQAQAPQTAPSSLYQGPDQLDLSHLATPVQDQGDRDSCAFFACTALIEARVMNDTGVLTPLSEQFLIYVVKSNPNNALTQDTDLPSVLDAARQKGVPSEASWPYNPVSRFGVGQQCARFVQQTEAPAYQYDIHPSVDRSCLAQDEPPPEVFEEAARICEHVRPRSSWRPVDWTPPGRDSPSLNPILRRMHQSSAPVLVTVKLPPGSEGWRDDGLVVVPERLRGNTAATEDNPNHFIVLTGFDRAQGVFTFKNSWGAGWGKDGHGLIPFDVVSTPFVQNVFFFMREPRAPMAAPA